MPLDLPFPFTLPRLFRSPAISNFFSFPLGLRNSGVRLYFYFSFSLNPLGLLYFYFYFLLLTLSCRLQEVLRDTYFRFIMYLNAFPYKSNKSKSTWSYENRVSKHFVISLNFPCLIAYLLIRLLMSFFVCVFVL